MVTWAAFAEAIAVRVKIEGPDVEAKLGDILYEAARVGVPGAEDVRAALHRAAHPNGRAERRAQAALQRRRR